MKLFHTYAVLLPEASKAVLLPYGFTSTAPQPSRVYITYSKKYSKYNYSSPKTYQQFAVLHLMQETWIRLKLTAGCLTKQYLAEKQYFQLLKSLTLGRMAVKLRLFYSPTTENLKGRVTVRCKFVWSCLISTNGF